MDLAISVPAELGIAALELGMALVPGPNMVYLVSRSITQGRRAGLTSVLGIATGFLVYLCAVTAGIEAVFEAVPALYLTLKLAGAGYLLWLAWKAVKPGGVAVFAPQQLPADPPRKLYFMGLLTCLLNPKIAVLYISLLPQFIDPARGHIAEQSFALGLAQITVGVAVNALIAICAGGIAGFVGKRPLWLRVQRYLMGTVLAGLAVKIVLDKASAVSPA